MSDVSFAEEFDIDYVDWASTINEGTVTTNLYQTYIITGYKVHGEANKKFQSNYVMIQWGKGDDNGLNDEESAWFQGVWDYALSGDTGRWSVPQQIVYFNDTSSDNITYQYGQRRLKVRGNGRSLQFRIFSEPGKAFYINGWSVWVTANTMP